MIRKIAKTTFVNAGTLLRGFQPCVLIFDLDKLNATYFDWDGARFAPSGTLKVP